MTKLTFDISVSLDGFVTGPDPRPEVPLGDDGEGLHDWAIRAAAWREQHGREGGETNADDAVIRETLDNTGAFVMGRKMFGGGEGPWDESWKGWWGEEPPFHVPVFVLTHHAREPLVMEGGTTFTFVTEGIEAALSSAAAAAGDRDVMIAGGADVAQQYLAAGLVDEFQVHVAPVLLGGGVRLFEDLGARRPQLEVVRVVESDLATHLRYRVVK